MEKLTGANYLTAALITLFAFAPQPGKAADGDIFVSDSPLILRVGANGTKVPIPTSILTPTGIAMDQLGNIFVADALTNSVIKIDSAGTQTTVTTGLNNPQDLISDPSGNLYVANAGDNTVVRIGQNGSKNTVATGLNNPQGLALDRLGNLLISNAGDNSIVKVSTDGTKSTVVSAGLNSPQGIAFDATGNLLVADAGSNSILKVTPSGTVSTKLAGLNSPQDVAVNNEGGLIVANAGTGSGNGSILNVDPTGVITTQASSLNSPQAFTAAPGLHQLLNISTRGPVGTGDNVLIGGFIVRGAADVGATRTLVRGIGPALAGGGVPNVLADPILELHDVTGALIATNDNWKDSQQAEIEATGLQPTNDSESAILATLPDGAYTVILRGQNGTTGNGLVEVYKVD